MEPRTATRERIPQATLRPYWAALWARERATRPANQPRLRFTCNLCGRRTSYTRSRMSRAARSCGWCGSTVRMRGVMDAVSVALWGESLPAPALTPKTVRGIGFSDPPRYARHLQRLTDYQNTWFHREPRRDVTDLASFGGDTYDFIVCSEVLEHINQPVQVAFDNLYRLLNPGGVLIASVPLSCGETVEHFPPLSSHAVEQTPTGWVLRGVRTDTGEEFTSGDLVFHGGPGSTVEMRVFGRADFAGHLRAAGFGDVTERIGCNPEFGIVTEGTPETIDTRGGAVRGLHAGVWIARRS